MTEEEYILTGGNTAGRVVRVGSTVRKPVSFATPSGRRLLEFLCENGYPASPQHFGIDEQGRQSLEFSPVLMANAGPPLGLFDLEKVDRLIRQLHDTTICFPISVEASWNAQKYPDDADSICHNDLAPLNLVLSADRWVFIDRDNSGPGSRLWDLSYAALIFPPVEPQGDITETVRRIAALILGYGLSPQACRDLPAMMSRRAQAMTEYLMNGPAMGVQPMVRLHADGHANY